LYLSYFATTRKLTNTNRHTHKIFSSVNCLQLNISSQYPSVNTNKHILSVYTKRIKVEKEGIKKKAKKYDDMLFLQT